LLLEDGTEVQGCGIGALRPVCGEVVFNTAMSGYVETLTDPSYHGQILVFTYPLIGNYGVPAARSESLGRPYESDGIQVQALVVQNYVDTHKRLTSFGREQWICWSASALCEPDTKDADHGGR
jgi:carbamoyl-phosphate synthase small subunit